MFLDNTNFRALKSHMMLIPGNPGSARLSEAMATAFGWASYQDMKANLDALEFDLTGRVPRRLVTVDHEAMIRRLLTFGMPQDACNTLALSLAWMVQAEFMALEPEEHAFLAPGRILDRQCLGFGYITALREWYEALCVQTGEQPRLQYSSQNGWKVTISTQVDPEGAFDYAFIEGKEWRGPEWDLFLDLDGVHPDEVERRAERAIDIAIELDISPERALFTLARQVHEDYLKLYPQSILRIDRSGIAVLVAADEEHLDHGRVVEVWLAEF